MAASRRQFDRCGGFKFLGLPLKLFLVPATGRAGSFRMVHYSRKLARRNIKIGVKAKICMK